MDGSRWDRERIAMPVKNSHCRRQCRKCNRFRGARGQLDRVPADFLVAVGTDLPPQHISNKLATQTDPDDFLPGIDRAADEFLFLCQPGISFMFINIHRPAHDRDHIERLDCRQQIMLIQMGVC